MPDPTSFLQWLHQTYTNAWKGVVDITTVPAEDHASKNSHWLSNITAHGAVVRRDGKNHSLQPITTTGDARSKKGAEHAAAEAIYRQLVAEGWWDPEAAPKPKKTGGVSRAHRYITDNVPCNENNPLAYLDISIDGQPAGRIVIELFRYKRGDTTELHAPMAVENFLALCQGVEVGGRRLSYVGTPFTRVVKRFVVQAGDVLNKDGTGGAHIHSSFGEHFPDEGLDDRSYRHTFPFMLSAANLGLEDTNSSQFFITVAPCSSLDGHHTCFGKVLRGYSTVKEIEHVHMLYSQAGKSTHVPEEPPVPVVITGAGELPPRSVLDATTAPVLSAGGYPMWAEDQGPPPDGVHEVAYRLDISSHLKQLGNEAYKQGDHKSALRLYRQSYQYLSWTTFKHRTSDGDCELTYDEQDSLWQAEGVLLGNMVAAQIKLGQFKAAVQETCPDLIRKASDNPKTYLRLAQVRIGLGPAEYDSAVSLLNQGLAKAKAQGAHTHDIVAELHRVKDLRKAHRAKLRAAFSSAFNSGLLHHPADDTPPPQAAAAAGHTWRGQPVAGGPVAPSHVLDDAGTPVLVKDAWGVHPLVVDGGLAYGEDPEQQRRLTELLLRQARLNNQGRYGPAAAASRSGGQLAEGQALFGDGGGQGGVGDGGDDWGVVGHSWDGVDAGVDAEEASGAQWWSEEGDSEGEREQQQQQQQLDFAPHGETASEQQQQQQQQSAYGVHANGSSSAAEDSGSELANGHDSCPAAASLVPPPPPPAAATTTEPDKDDGRGVCSEAGSDEAGVPESVDAAGESGMLSDTRSVAKGGYGWNPEALPKWTNTH